MPAGERPRRAIVSPCDRDTRGTALRFLGPCFTLVLVALPGTMAVAADSGDERRLVESLIDAWTKREHAIRSCEVSWKSVQFMSEEYFRLIEQDGVEQPHEGKSYTQQYGLSFDGPKLRFAIAKKAWSAKQQRFLETPYVSVFDGQIGKSLWGEQELVPYPSGTI